MLVVERWFSRGRAVTRLARLVQRPDDGLSGAGDGHKLPALQLQLVQNCARSGRRLVDVTVKCQHGTVNSVRRVM